MYRLSIELRNHRSGVPTLSNDGEGNTSECVMRVFTRLSGVRDLMHVHKLHEREPGDLGRDCCIVPRAVGSGKAQDRNPGVYTSEKSDRPIVPEKLSNKVSAIIAIWPGDGGDS